MMDESVSILKAKRVRKAKTELERRSFKDGAIYLFKRADYKKPTWLCRVKVPNAKGYVSCSTKTTDEHAAYAFANDLFNKTFLKVANGQDIQSKRVSVLISEFTAELEQASKVSPSAKTRIEFLRRTQVFFGNKRIKEVDAKVLVELNDWIVKGSRRGSLAQNTLIRYSVDLKQFLNWCEEREYIDKLPRFPKIKYEGIRRPHFDNRDWAKLVRHLREFVKHDNGKVRRDRLLLRDYVLIMGNTGIRVGEARNLKWRDIREVHQPEGSELPSNVAVYVRGKTGAREVVARTSAVKIYFRRILEMRTAELDASPTPEDYVFCNRDGTPIGSFKKSFAALLKSAGVETDTHGQKRTIYSLRHTYATFRLQEGVHQFILAKNMGTSVAMLEKHYGHTSNVASAAELTKGGRFKSGNKATAVDWLME